MSNSWLLDVRYVVSGPKPLYICKTICCSSSITCTNSHVFAYVPSCLLNPDVVPQLPV